MTPINTSSRISSSFDRSLARFLRFLFRFRKSVLLLTLLVTVLCLYSSSYLKMQENIMDLFPKNDPLISQFQQILTDFNQLNQLVVELGPADDKRDVPEEELTLAADQLAADMQASGLFKRVTSQMDLSDFPTAMQLLRDHRPSFFGPEDQQSFEKKLDPGSIGKALAIWKRQLFESPAPFIARSLYRDPVGLDELILKKMSALYALDGPVSFQKGRFFSRDLRHLLILAEPAFPATDSFRSKDLVGFMTRAVAKAQGSAKSGNLRIAYLSGHRISLENASRIKRDIKWTLIISILAIALASLVVYRRPLWVGLTMLPTFFGGIVAVGLLRWMWPDFSPIAVGCGSMLVGIAVDLGIHILYHIDQSSDEAPSQDQIIAIIVRLFWPLILCSATTIVAFFSLEWSVLPGYQSLGHFAVIGFIGATVFAIFILPLLIPTGGKTKVRRPVLPIAALYPRFFAWSDRHRKAILTALIAFSLAVAPGLAKLQFEGDYQKLNAISPATRADWDRIMTIFGSALSSSSIVIHGQTMEESLQQNERVYQVLKDLQARGIVKSIQSIAPLLPSGQAQRQNIERWRKFWAPARLAALRENLSRAAAAQRMNSGKFEPFYASLPGPLSPLDAQSFQTGVFRPLVANYVSQAPGRYPMLTYLKLADPGRFSAVEDALKAAGISFIAYHKEQLFGHVIRLVYREMIWISAITILLVVLILVAYYKSLMQLALLVLPLLVNLYWTFGIMGWFDIRINMLNSLIVVFIFGVVVDYAIFLATSMDKAPDEADPFLTHSSVAISMSGLTTMIGLGVLIVAQHPALYSIGLTSLLGIGSGLVAVFLIIPLTKTYSRHPRTRPAKRPAMASHTTLGHPPD